MKFRWGWLVTNIAHGDSFIMAFKPSLSGKYKVERVLVGVMK